MSEAAASFAALEDELLGTAAERPAAASVFPVDSAYQGQEGLEMVKKAVAEGRPYAMAFVDVRMPPGWDGVETTIQLWKSAPDLQIVICTAYSDYSWDEMLARIGGSDQLVILKKPFDTIEVLQLANALTEKWNLLRETRAHAEELERRVRERTAELEAANAALQEEISRRARIEADLQQAKEAAELRRPGEERLPCEHEPRGAHADERGHRHGEPAAQQPARRPSSATSPRPSAAAARRC